MYSVMQPGCFDEELPVIHSLTILTQGRWLLGYLTLKIRLQEWAKNYFLSYL